MKEHKGMRPQDIVVLLKIITRNGSGWYNKDLANELGISNSEISESLHRSLQGGLLRKDKRTLHKDRLVNFLSHGVRYVFPAQPGSISRGMPTAHSAPPLNDEFILEEPYIWPGSEGTVRGVAVLPLYPTVPAACRKDKRLYILLAMVDALRISRPEEQEPILKKLAKSVYGIQG